MASDVSQRAREAAADIWRDYVAKVGEVIVERCMREGGLDDGLPSILARFEAEIRADATAIERERCAVVAEHFADFVGAQKAHPQPLAIDTNEGWRRVQDGALDVSAAIRKGPTP